MHLCKFHGDVFGEALQPQGYTLRGSMACHVPQVIINAGLLVTQALRSFSACFSGVTGFLAFLASACMIAIHRDQKAKMEHIADKRLSRDPPRLAIQEAHTVHMVGKLAKLLGQDFFRRGFVDPPSQLHLGCPRICMFSKVGRTHACLR